jgi:transcriptional regulator with XRE-family HTH domain
VYHYTAVNVIQELEKQVSRHGSQKAAATALGISAQYLNDLLQGRRDASDNILEKLGLRRVVVRAK